MRSPGGYLVGAAPHPIAGAEMKSQRGGNPVHDAGAALRCLRAEGLIRASG